MKKNRFIVLAILSSMLVSCSDDDVLSDDMLEKDTELTETVKPASRSIEDAIAIALDAASLNGTPSSRNNAIVDNVVSITSCTSRASADTLIYAVNYADNGGYALISANTSCDAVLAVTESGHFTSEDEIENPGMKLFMNYAKNYAIIGPDVPILPPGPENPQMRDWVYDNINDSVPARVIAKYGYYSSKPTIGCNAIAAAHALSLFERPDTIHLSKSNTILSLNWYAYKHLDDPICMYENDNCYSFIEELAIRMNSGQYPGAAYIDDCRELLKKFLPNNVGNLRYGQPDTYALIKNDGVIVVAGFSQDSNGNLIVPGHTWVIDGYVFKKIIDIEYIVTFDRTTGREISRTLSYDHSRVLSYLVHYNWGWKGVDNGYFDYNVVHPYYGTYYDGATGNGKNQGYKANMAYFVVK